MMDIISEIGSSLDEEYQNEKVMMEVRPEYEPAENNKVNKFGKKSKKNDVVMTEIDIAIAKDSKTLVEKVAEVRGLDIKKIKCIMVMDTGQGSLKVCEYI